MSVNSVNTVNQHEQKYKKPGLLTCAGGYLAGSYVVQLSQEANKKIGPKIMAKVKAQSVIDKAELSKVEKAITTTLDETGLSKKGITVLKSSLKNTAEVTEIMTKELGNNFKFLPKVIREFAIKSQVDGFVRAFQTGNNSCYAHLAKKVILPEKGLILSAFHEMGHAANANLSTFGKILQKSRMMTILTIPVFFTALLKTKKAPNEKPKGKIDKTTDFIKNNAGKLTFLSFVPILLEEGLASIKGVKFAKKVLSPELVKKVSKTNKTAYLTYLGLALSMSTGMYLGNKVKDAIAHPKPVEQEN